MNVGFTLLMPNENVRRKRKREKVQVFSCAVEKLCERKLLKVSLEMVVIKGMNEFAGND